MQWHQFISTTNTSVTVIPYSPTCIFQNSLQELGSTGCGRSWVRNPQGIRRYQRWIQKSRAESTMELTHFWLLLFTENTNHLSGLHSVESRNSKVNHIFWDLYAIVTQCMSECMCNCIAQSRYHGTQIYLDAGQKGDSKDKEVWEILCYSLFLKSHNTHQHIKYSAYFTTEHFLNTN